MSPSKPKRKREYRSPLRADNATATRAVIVAAALDQFSAHGYAGVSVEAIAAAAGVSRATVFSAVGGKPKLIELACDLAFARAAGGPLARPAPHSPLSERPQASALLAIADQRGFLRGYAALAARLSAQLAPIFGALRAAASDPELAPIWQRTVDERRRGTTFLIAEMARRGPLRLDHATAEDVLWVFNDTGLYAQLVHQRGWTHDRFAAWLADLLERELLP